MFAGPLGELTIRFECYGNVAEFPHVAQMLGPSAVLPQCSQNLRLFRVRFAQISFASFWLPVSVEFAHHDNPSPEIGPPQSRQNREPALTARCVAMSFPPVLCLKSRALMGTCPSPRAPSPIHEVAYAPTLNSTP